MAATLKVLCFFSIILQCPTSSGTTKVLIFANNHFENVKLHRRVRRPRVLIGVAKALGFAENYNSFGLTMDYGYFRPH